MNKINRVSEAIFVLIWTSDSPVIGRDKAREPTHLTRQDLRDAAKGASEQLFECLLSGVWPGLEHFLFHGCAFHDFRSLSLGKIVVDFFQKVKKKDTSPHGPEDL